MPSSRTTGPPPGSADGSPLGGATFTVAGPRTGGVTLAPGTLGK
jgi:hypothetical protein